jgi:hypothetical protein
MVRFTSFLTKHGFRGSKAETSLFVLHHGSATAYLMLYMDDTILTASSQSLLQQTLTKLQFEFAMTCFSPMQY